MTQTANTDGVTLSALDSLPPELDRVLISLNPIAGKRAARPSAEELTERLIEQGFTAEILTDLDRLTDTAGEYQDAGTLRAVVAVGGDGTAAEIVNRTPAGVPLAVLPHGTENLLAKYLGIDGSPQSVCDVIAAGKIARLDAGRAKSLDPTSQPRDRLFLLMASSGLDADVVQRLEQARRGHISHLSYLKPIVQAIRKYQYPELRIWQPGKDAVGASESTPMLARWMFLFNLPCYAQGLGGKLVPDARGDDGLLDLCTFRRGSFWTGLRYLLAVLRRRHGNAADCTMRRVTRLRVESDVPAPFQLDGDFGGMLPLEIELLPKRLTLLVPEACA